MIPLMVLNCKIATAEVMAVHFRVLSRTISQDESEYMKIHTFELRKKE